MEITLLTIEETARLLACSKSLIYKKTCRKELSFIKLGNRLRFKKSDILSYIESNYHEATINN